MTASSGVLAEFGSRRPSLEHPPEVPWASPCGNLRTSRCQRLRIRSAGAEPVSARCWRTSDRTDSGISVVELWFEFDHLGVEMSHRRHRRGHRRTPRRPTCRHRSCARHRPAPRQCPRSCTRTRGPPTPSTTAVAPELRTQNRSPTVPRMYASPLVAPYRITLPAMMLSSATKSACVVARGPHHQASAREPLAEIVVGVAVQPHREPAGHERTEALPGGSVEREVDGVGSGRPSPPCAAVMRWPSIVPTVRFTLLIGSSARTSSRCSRAGLASSMSWRSSARSRPWSWLWVQ